MPVGSDITLSTAEWRAIRRLIKATGANSIGIWHENGEIALWSRGTDASKPAFFATTSSADEPIQTGLSCPERVFTPDLSGPIVMTITDSSLEARSTGAVIHSGIMTTPAPVDLGASVLFDGSVESLIAAIRVCRLWRKDDTDPVFNIIHVSSDRSVSALPGAAALCRGPGIDGIPAFSILSAAARSVSDIASWGIWTQPLRAMLRPKYLVLDGTVGRLNVRTFVQRQDGAATSNVLAGLSGARFDQLLDTQTDRQREVLRGSDIRAVERTFGRRVCWADDGRLVSSEISSDRPDGWPEVPLSAGIFKMAWVAIGEPEDVYVSWSRQSPPTTTRIAVIESNDGSIAAVMGSIPIVLESRAPH